MPIRKNHLNKNEAASYLRSLDELRGQGFDFGDHADIPTAARCPVIISDGGSRGWVKAFGENAIYGIWLRLAASAPVVIDSVEIRASFDSFSIELPYLRADKGYYLSVDRKYRQEELLNDYFDQPCRIYTGDMVEGLLLAYGVVSVPEELKGKFTQVSITLIDVCGRQVEEEIVVEVMRRAVPLPPAGRRVGDGLRGDRKPKQDGRSLPPTNSESPQSSGNPVAEETRPAKSGDSAP